MNKRIILSIHITPSSLTTRATRSTEKSTPTDNAKIDFQTTTKKLQKIIARFYRIVFFIVFLYEHE